jgi:hypothetical protein
VQRLHRNADSVTLPLSDKKATLNLIDLFVTPNICTPNAQYLLAKAECDFQAPFQFCSPVEVLQGVHAGLSIAAARVAVAEDGLQSRLAAVVVVAQVQGQVTRTLEAEVPGQLCFRFRTCRTSGQRIPLATTARTQNHMPERLPDCFECQNTTQTHAIYFTLRHVSAVCTGHHQVRITMP